MFRALAGFNTLPSQASQIGEAAEDAAAVEHDARV